jgi:biotin carboxylase
MSEKGGSTTDAAAQPLSPRMASRLAASDPTALTRSGSDAQSMRRTLLDHATVVVIGAGYHAKRFIYERAADLGVQLVVVDHPGHWSEQLVADGIIAAFVPADLYLDVPKQVAQVLEGLAALKMEADGVCTFWEDSVPVVARVAEALGVPGNDPEAVDAARSKRLTLLQTRTMGLPTPRFAAIKDADDLSHAVEHVGFPAVIKPEFGTVGFGCYRVDSVSESIEAHARIVSLLPTWDPIFTEYGTNLLLEEYLDGTEFDIDLLFSEGRCVYSAVSENWPTDEPYFFESGLHAPSHFPQDQVDEMVDLSIRGTQALGLELGAFHVEGKITSRGPRIVEINARMGGSIVRDTNLMVHGVDLVEEHLMATVGIPIRPVPSDHPMCGVANILIYAERTATIASTDFVEHFASDPRVFFAVPAVEAGQQVQSAADGFPTLLIEVALRERDASEAVDAIRKLAESVTITYR